MYLINPLSLQIAQTLFITISRYRAAQGLVGPKDGSNETFTTPADTIIMNVAPLATDHLFADYILAPTP